MSTREEIEQSIRNNLPIVFGKSESVNPEAFQQKYNALLEYATAVSAPFLGPETIRYQSMLLYLSALFLSVALFRIAAFKLGETAVPTDSKLLVIYAVFIGAIAVIFLTKAYVDNQRARFLRARNAQTSSELQELISVGIAMRHIQEYFWFEIFDVIGLRYKTYDDATRAVLKEPPVFEHISMQAMSLNRTALSKNPVTSGEIVRQDSYLADMLAEVTNDEKHFQDEAEIILSDAQSRPVDLWMDFADRPIEKIRAAYDRHLSKWIDARNNLNNEHFDLVFDGKSKADLHRAQALLHIVTRIRAIRRIYTVLEIVAPVVFAIFTILYAPASFRAVP